MFIPHIWRGATSAPPGSSIEPQKFFIQNGKNQLTTFYSLPSAPVAKTILRRSPEYTEGGFSWVLVDAEHGLINDSHYYEVCPSIIELISRIKLLTLLPSSPMLLATRALALLSVCPGLKSG